MAIIKTQHFFFEHFVYHSNLFGIVSDDGHGPHFWCIKNCFNVAVRSK